MPAPSQLNSRATSKHDVAQQHGPGRSDVQSLLQFSARGLGAMFDKEKQAFCHRLLSTNQGLVSEGISPRYTIMTLLGLKEWESAGGKSSFDLRAIYSSFVRDAKWIDGAGDTGLLLWLIAAFEPNDVEKIFHSLDCKTALDRFVDARERHTMELSWFLSGLAHAAETNPKLTGSLMDLAMKTYRVIMENQGQHGFFGHKGTKSSLSGFLRGAIGSFADQVYPTYALSKFAKAFHVEDALNPAVACATSICRAQGKLGQWWWLYDARSGRVSSRYPVYSVHQHGMAPMCLFAVQDATGKSFEEPLYKGLAWIYGSNELGVDIRDANQTLIWRCILPKNRRSKFWDITVNAIKPSNSEDQRRPLEVLHEQRPYEYGWLLYAFAKHSPSDEFPSNS
ncbi:MAG TPA: hypothetical protein VMG30_21440 [Acidobacteriota bacterium]|nr:hypothetical protein [Acidobacteriota bacterium]HUL15912.1 hypothetical protein [Terriglobales bacterium]